MSTKKIIFGIYAVLIFLFSGLFLYVFTFEGNNYRIAKAESLANQAQNAEAQNRLIYLIQSDILAPNDQKKLEIADLYLNLGNSAQAEWYLNRVKSKEGIVKLADISLENADYDKAKKFMDKISDQDVRLELEIFADLSQGKEEKLKELPVEPKTNPGKLTKAINTGDFAGNPSDSLLGDKIAEIIAEKLGKTRQTLEVADMFSQNKQPSLARFMLAGLEKEHSNLKDLYVIWARSYEVEKNYIKALEYAKKAITTDPSDLNLYKNALNYANLAQNETEANYLKEQIKYLESIQAKRCTTCGA